jgi:hypothetical protein
MLDENQINERLQGLRAALESDTMDDELRVQVEALVADFEKVLASPRMKKLSAGSKQD